MLVVMVKAVAKIDVMVVRIAVMLLARVGFRVRVRVLGFRGWTLGFGFGFRVRLWFRI